MFIYLIVFVILHLFVYRLTRLSNEALQQVIGDLKTCLGKADALQQSSHDDFADQRPVAVRHTRIINQQVRFESTKKRNQVKPSLSKPDQSTAETIKKTLMNGGIDEWLCEDDDQHVIEGSVEEAQTGKYICMV